MKHLTVFIALILAASGLLHAEEAGTLPLRPGAVHPQPRQRGLDEIDALPVRQAPCPACGYVVDIPEADKLIRRPAGHQGDLPKWEMHAATRDADFCPHPAKGKVAFQADIVTCPSCGFTSPAATFERSVSPAVAAWTKQTLRPNLREAQYRLLGRRAAEMNEAEVVEFFKHQEEIPDSVRTEHARIYSLAGNAPKLRQAEATWLAAWAIRRELAGPPKGAFLAKRADGVAEALSKLKRKRATVADEIEALTHLLGKSGGKDRLPYPDQLAAGMLRAGLRARQGFYRQAEDELGHLLLEARERFFLPQQDPLWSATNGRAGRDQRAADLENIRGEIEREVIARLEMLRSEQALVARASEIIREALLAGELDGKPDEALFHAYLVAEFLRRTGNPPLAAEWFKNLINLAPETAAVRTAAKIQLRLVMDNADEHVNLLSALGQDGELFEKLREICHTVPSVR